MSEEKRPWPLAIPHALLSIFVDEMGFYTYPYLLLVVGIKSAKVTLIFPIVRLVASVVAWYTGYLPMFSATPIHNILYSILLIINERERRSTPNLPSVATGERISQPGSQIPRDYRYERLAQQRSIRILTLVPSGIFEAPLECRLFEAPLDNAPSYTALSYAWDASEGTTSIVCNGSFLKVTRNCARALHRIRQIQGSNGINLWVDAICIEQGNTPEALYERAQQIQIMGEVYKRASHVTAWVGEHECNSRCICEFLESVGRAVDGELEDASAWTKVESLALKKVCQWGKFVNCLREFFQRSWFTRMWPIQEVTLPLPGTVSLLCGDSSIPFEYIRAGWQVLAKIGLLAGSVDLDQSVALQFYLADALALKRNYSSTTRIRRLGRPLITDLSQLSLPSIMRATRFKACSLAKDKFFALYGVFEELEVPHKVDISRYTEMTEAEVFLAVFESCVAFDNSLDVLRLAQSPDGYVGHDDFWTKRQDPYDSLANVLFGTVAKVAPMLFRGVVDNAPKWRASLPSWVPDWTQWTHSDMDDRDIALIRSYSTRAMWNRPLLDATNGTKLGSPIRNDLHDTKPVARILYGRLPTPDGARESRVSWSIKNRPKIRVQAKVIGVVRSVGSVDSVGLRTGNPMPLAKDPFFQPAPDAFVAATIETVRNFVVNSSVAQIVLSLRMVYQNFGVMAFFIYFNAVYETWRLQPVLKRAVCSLCPSAAACLGSGLEFGEPSWITIGILTVLCMFDPGEDPSSGFAPFYRRFRRQISTLIVCGAWLVWEFRISLYNTMYSDSYKEWPSWFTEPFLIVLIAQGVIPIAGYFEDEVLILLGRVIMATGNLAIVSVILFSPLRYLAIVALITTGIQACRCIQGAVVEVLGSEMFARHASFTSGLNFFTTKSGLTGSTRGPVQLFDVVVIVDRASDPIVMRCRGKEFEIVGAAYIGNKSRKELEESSGSWSTIYVM